MNTEMPTDEVTDSIAHIEMQRQDAARESGLAAACSEALRKLHALLASEQQLQPPGSGRSANVQAVATEIERVKRLASGSKTRPHARDRRPANHQSPRPERPRNGGRNKGRRAMGRGGGR